MGTQPFIGSIQIFGFNFAPRNYAYCNGQLLSIAQNTALFSLLGTQYGGNGTTTFALPDLRSRVPMHFGQGPGLSPRQIGEVGGTESVTLLSTQMPAHNHTFTNTSTLNATQAKGTDQIPATGSLLARPINNPANAIPQIYVPAGTVGDAVALGGLNVAGTIGVAGGSQPHPNMQPYLVLNFCIALQGIFPSRN
ncbi:phage tail protein [Sphingomonas sp. Leaf33]|uniref:phage tail protein n=1 Tax=Sphingomonas sp. Leaf33 TaxID=1736215 RepID=UPI0006F884C7|nr:tail fiber protein [Sphingomonas sp. Leaf33]KQN21205.1 phage tail protein [Sphingomonas sp. Leaf33]